jgi:hypothetical protein
MVFPPAVIRNTIAKRTIVSGISIPDAMKNARTAASPATNAFSGRRIRICPGIFNSCQTSGKYLNRLPAISRYRIAVLIISRKLLDVNRSSKEKILSIVLAEDAPLLPPGYWDQIGKRGKRV